MIPIEPSSKPVWMRRRSAVLVLPVSRATSTPVGARYFEMFAKCCWARTSVGAMMQAWQPFPTAIRDESTATMVLPEPTSPCRRRFIWRPLIMSVRISLMTRFWAPVRS